VRYISAPFFQRPVHRGPPHQQCVGDLGHQHAGGGQLACVGQAPTCQRRRTASDPARARAAASPAIVRSWLRPRSNSASAPKTCNTSRRSRWLCRSARSASATPHLEPPGPQRGSADAAATGPAGPAAPPPRCPPPPRGDIRPHPITPRRAQRIKLTMRTLIARRHPRIPK
jgi:hypothetical protein